MDFVVKVSLDYTDSTVQAQFINPADLTFTSELKGFGRMSFLLPVDDPQLSAIVEHYKIAVYEVSGGADVLIWSGYIDEPEFDFDNAVIFASDEKRGLQHKRIFEQKAWAAVSVADILDELATEANARSGGDRGNLSYTTDVAESVTKTFEKGDSYYNIIDSIASQLEVEWTVVLNEIKLLETIGEDKSDDSGTSFVEIVSNRNSPNENTIATFKDKRSGNLLTTSLIGKSGGGYSQATNNTATFGHIESTKNFPEGDLAAQTTADLAENSGSISTIVVTANTDRIEYNEVEVGDLIKLRIEGYSPVINTSGPVKVLKKSVEIKDRIPSMKLTVSDTSRIVRDPANVLAKIERRLSAIEIQ